MIVELVDITENATEKIGKFAAICYDAKTDQMSNIKRAINCKDRGHLATMRFASATFYIGDISRVCSHQFVRSKHLDFLQQSQRYVDMYSAQTILPDGLEDDLHVKNYLLETKNLYWHLRNKGCKKEDARYILPEGTQTSLYVTGNFQAWTDFINLRKGPEVQTEIRQVAYKINELLHKNCPELFEELT